MTHLPNAHDSVRQKVAAIFTEWAGERAMMLSATTFPAGIATTIMIALAGPAASEKELLHSDQIAFHLTDWSADAAFIVAVHLFPERFTAEEIEAGVHQFLCHVPDHVNTAARLVGHPAEEQGIDEAPSSDDPAC